jgi:hypothetical protein
MAPAIWGQRKADALSPRVRLAPNKSGLRMKAVAVPQAAGTRQGGRASDPRAEVGGRRGNRSLSFWEPLVVLTLSLARSRDWIR